MKRLIRFFLRTIVFLLLLVVLVLSVINAPVFLVNSKKTKTDYSNWMSQTIASETKVVEIKMLGAHDAFTHEIGIFSEVDEISAEGLMKGFVGRLIKGFSLRQSKTQTVGATDLLKSGVRYFDVRLSYYEHKKEYYTTHNYFSSPFKEVLKEIQEFLVENPGEFLILDLQHIYGIDYENEADFLKIAEYFTESGLLDYAYKNDQKPLSEVTYADVTSGGTKSGLIILSKFQEANNYFWDYESNIYSPWANSDNFQDIVNFLKTEKTYILDSGKDEGFVVLQAVTTMQVSPKGIASSLKSWSLLKRARDFNLDLIDYEELTDLLAVFPIIMTDFSSDFKTVDLYMELIIAENQK